MSAVWFSFRRLSPPVSATPSDRDADRRPRSRVGSGMLRVVTILGLLTSTLEGHP